MPKPTVIKPVSDTDHVFIGLYSEPGKGKTRFVGTSPGKVLILRPPVDHTDSLLPADKARVEEWVIRNWSDMNDAEEYLRHEGDQYDWVWLDSLSLCQDYLLDDMFADAVTRKPSRADYGPDQAEYGVNMYRIGAWMRHVIGPDLFNFGWTGHAQPLLSPDLDEDGDPVEKLMPWVQGKNMSPKCCGYMNLVCFLEQAGKDKKRRILRSQSDARFYAKDQFDALSDGVLWDPTMPRLLDLIKKSPGRGTPAAAKTTGGAPRRKAKPVIKRGR